MPLTVIATVYSYFTLMVAAAITKTSDKKKVSRGRMSGARDVNHALTSWSVRCLIAFFLIVSSTVRVSSQWQSLLGYSTAPRFRARSLCEGSCGVGEDLFIVRVHVHLM